MSCNGCRVLRKGCNDNCVLRQSLQGIESPQAQANATIFVAKFFGRAGLMSFISAVPESQRPALFQSLLFEACGRTVNPVSGAIGLLGTGNWPVCQSAVETVLRGGMVRAMPEIVGGSPAPESDEAHVDFFGSQDLDSRRSKARAVREQPDDLDLGLTSGLPGRMTAGGRVKRRAATPSMNSDESDTTSLESGSARQQSFLQGHGETKLLRLFF
ncbi:hypothetical protein RJ639_033433 [Escallonia herrerae]|uniref:LOB domain-containing protein n=1 Tax=Escallonia herrerae TaxID=1293975 RepID=A0AA89BL59_9ASTE|nr:hypothetical protein RJ639_033433 [Escallonia herrerae]